MGLAYSTRCRVRCRVRCHRPSCVDSCFNIMDNMLQKMEQYANSLEDIVGERTKELTEEKKKTDMLLYRMLPPCVPPPPPPPPMTVRTATRCPPPITNFFSIAYANQWHGALFTLLKPRSTSMLMVDFCGSRPFHLPSSLSIRSAISSQSYFIISMTCITL